MKSSIVSGSQPHSIGVGDLNNDHQTDIVNDSTNNVEIHLGYDNGTLTSQEISSTLSNSHSLYIAVGDLNNDHLLDLVVSNNVSENVAIFLDHRSETF